MTETSRGDVAEQLEAMSAPGGVLRLDGDRTTARSLQPGALVLRAAQIGQTYLESQPDVATDGAIAVVTAGPPGAGKSTLLREEGFLRGTYRNIDPDEIKALLLSLALEEGTFDDLMATALADGLPVRPMELATLVHEESVAIASNLFEISLRRGENIILQGSLGWDELPSILLGQLDEQDYDSLTIVDVEVDEDTAIRRSLDRWWDRRCDLREILGGRYVPESVIRGLYGADGKSRCEVNADLMLITSKIPSTRLIRESNIAGMQTRTVTTNTNRSQDDVERERIAGD